MEPFMYAAVAVVAATNTLAVMFARDRIEKDTSTSANKWAIPAFVLLAGTLIASLLIMWGTIIN